MNRAFFDRVRRQFHAIAKREPRRVARVDARRSIPQVQKEILAVVRERLSETGLRAKNKAARS